VIAALLIVRRRAKTALPKYVVSGYACPTIKNYKKHFGSPVSPPELRLQFREAHHFGADFGKYRVLKAATVNPHIQSVIDMPPGGDVHQLSRLRVVPAVP